MRRIRLALTFMVVLVAAGCADDVVDGPFVTDWRLDERQCAVVEAGIRCYDLTLTVIGGEGAADASCRVSAVDVTTAEIVVDEPIPSVGGFTIQAGDMPVFSIDLPVVDNPEFSRWQVDCDPGAPG